MTRPVDYSGMYPGDRVTYGSNELPRNPPGRIGWPVAVARVNSLFGPRNGSFHDGLDFSAPRGHPIFSAHDGEVILAERLGNYGRTILVRGLRDRLITLYAHCENLLVEVGERVDQGQVIATIGTSGNATGPHLHFEVRFQHPRRGEISADPLPFILGTAPENTERYGISDRSRYRQPRSGVIRN